MCIAALLFFVFICASVLLVFVFPHEAMFEGLNLPTFVFDVCTCALCSDLYFCVD